MMLVDRLRRLMGRPVAPEAEADAGWHLVVDGRKLARLHAPTPDDMFWISFAIEPLSEPADPRLADEEFWAGDTWRIFSAVTGRDVGIVLAAVRALDEARQRVRLRGLHP